MNVSSVIVQRLHADLGDAAMGYEYGGAANNVSWAGEQWAYKLDDGHGHFINGVVESEMLSVLSNGTAIVNVPNSEAIIVYIGDANQAPPGTPSATSRGTTSSGVRKNFTGSMKIGLVLITTYFGISAL
ncbi:hypothetical protein GQ53DRAFT_740620 [Thozetella sp. PMI_491]|nr:hypothetical protein GQ53DRAFT_740620 [Thozetella sp. PMI_491]